jgi:hypothetical protein
MTILKRACVVAIVFSSVSVSPGFGQPVITDVGGRNRHPTFQIPRTIPPALNQLVTLKDAVVVKWVDGSDNATRFEVEKRNATGAWIVAATIPIAANRDAQYQWTDASKDVSGQCYRVSARTELGARASGPVECTVRPDGFPTGSVEAYKKWWDLSNVNQGVGKLRRTETSSDVHLIQEHQTFGVDLGLGRGGGGNNLKLQRTGNNPEPLMYGEKLAMRVWGAGWVKYGSEAFGINLKLSDTPSYEWYVLGGEIGHPIDGQDSALWNSVAKAFLVPGSRTWGVQLVWGGETTPTTQPTPPPAGVKTFYVFNCSVEQRPMGMWVRDLTSNGAWTESGTIQQQYDSSGSCPGSNPPWQTTLESGHSYEIRAIDFQMPGCTNDPQMQGSCIKSDTFIQGGPSGAASSTIS